MTYLRQTWENENLAYPLSAGRMSYIEDGIEAAHDNLDTHAAEVENVHGIPNVADLLTRADLTTDVHISNTYSNRPAASSALDGVRFFATDKLMEWQCIAGAWVLLFAYAPHVTSLPVSPIDGQECKYLADATNGIVWHLRYRAASASTYKWEYVGGSGLYTAWSGDQSLTVDNAGGTWRTYAFLPSLSVPFAGDYTVTAEHLTYINGPSTTASLWLDVTTRLTWNGVRDDDPDNRVFSGTERDMVDADYTTEMDQHHSTWRTTGSPAGTVAPVIQCSDYGSTGTSDVKIWEFALTITPARVG